MNSKHIITTILSFVFSTYLCAESPNNCPDYNTNESYYTKNFNGKSTYKDEDTATTIKYIIQNYNLDLLKPALDFGAGYGGATYEMLKMGAKNIYVSDSNLENLNCMKNHINNKFTIKNFKIHYIDGDITEKSIAEKIPNNKFGFVFSKNAIHFLTAKKMVDFFNVINKKTEINGIIVLIYENPLLLQQSELIKKIENKYKQQQKENPNIVMDDIIKREYANTELGKYSDHCSIQAYEETPESIRLPGFPCQFDRIHYGHKADYQLIMPEDVFTVLEKIGFKILAKQIFDNEFGSILIVGKKIHDS